MHFWTAYGKCTCKSKIILSTLYPLDTFRYDTVSLSMTTSHLQIAVFLNSHPGSAFGRPVVMAGLRPAMTTGGLDDIPKLGNTCTYYIYIFQGILFSKLRFVFSLQQHLVFTTVLVCPRNFISLIPLRLESGILH